MQEKETQIKTCLELGLQCLQVDQAQTKELLPNLEFAAKHFGDAAELGSPEGLVCQARMLESMGDLLGAEQAYCRAAAQHGLSDAVFRLAEMHETHNSAPPTKIFELYAHAATQGHVKAILHQAVCYMTGFGVSKPKPTEAALMMRDLLKLKSLNYKIRAELAYWIGHFHMVHCKDLGRAKAYFLWAASRHHDLAQYVLETSFVP